MSKSNVVGSTEVPTQRCSLLLLEENLTKGNSSTIYHTHPFWQIEFGITRGLEAKILGQTVSVQKGEVLLIPPHTLHAVIYPSESTQFSSIKFQTSVTLQGAKYRLLTKSPMTDLFDGTLQQLVNQKTARGEGKQRCIEHLLASILTWAYLDDEAPAIFGGILDRIEAVISKIDRQKVTVSMIARELDMSPGYISALYRKERGQALKKRIDEAYGIRAMKMLSFSDLNISDIARLLYFRDVFAFSRFFRRQAGASPREFRKRQRNPQANT